MKIVSEIGGFSLKDADGIRRGMGKKKVEYLLPYKEAFLKGATERGVTETYAEYFWEEVLIGFGAYAFNKSHSVAYSYLTYVCAWLKAHYPIEFFAALMSVRSLVLQPQKWNIKAPAYVREAKDFEIDIRFPDINRSMDGFTIVDNGIYFGFSSIKRVGTTTAQMIIEARGNQKFKGIIDFLKRVDRSKVNTAVFEQLVISGAFDCLGYKRSDLVNKKEELYEYFKNLKIKEERLLENALREQQNIEIQSKIEYRDELRKKAKKNELEQDEILFLEENKRLSLKKPLKLPEVEKEFVFDRYKQVPIDIEDLLNQGIALGCFILHPARLAYPNTIPIGEMNYIGDYHIAGLVREVKSYSNSKGKRTYITVGDGTGEISIPIYENTRLKIPEKNSLVEVKLKGGVPDYSDDNEDDIVVPRCFKVYSLNIYNGD